MKDAPTFDGRRWSDLVPPHAALSFAAVWDPVEGMIVFSGAHLLDAEGPDRVTTNPLQDDSPRDALDSQSQVLTIDLLAHAGPGTSFDATRIVDHAYREPHWGCEGQTDTDTVIGSQFLPAWLGIPPGMNTGLHSPAVASSAALTGFLPDSEPYLPRGSYRAGHIPSATHKRLPVRFETPWAGCEDAVSDEGFFEGGQMATGSYASLPVFVNLNMSSAFSVTTTSTNNYVEVDFPPSESDPSKYEDDASSWETLHGVDRAYCLNVPPPQRRRRLKKPRVDTKIASKSPASPAEVLAREHYNHASPSSTPLPSPCSSPTSTLSRKMSVARAKALLDRLGKCTRREDEEGWVCVEVKQKVTQQVARNIV